MFAFSHKRHILDEDLDDAKEALERDRHTVESEKTYDDERQKLALTVMNQSLNTIALLMAQAVNISVHTAQEFVSKFFIIVAIIFITTVAKNTLFVYKKQVSSHLGSNVYDVGFQYLSIISMFFFYLVFTLIRSYFEINTYSIPFIIAGFGLYLVYVTVWNKDTQTRNIVRLKE